MKEEELVKLLGYSSYSPSILNIHCGLKVSVFSDGSRSSVFVKGRHICTTLNGVR
jgi:hypothetical protein